jgi:sugar/nucleoside kinase (ribokinase family)
MHTVICHGAICADLRLYLPRHPRPGDGVRVRAATWCSGGNALIEARALINEGIPVLLTGDMLGPDDAGDLVAAELARLNLAAGVARAADAVTPVCHVLITPDGERSILAIRKEPPRALLPTAAQIAASRIVSVTRYGPFTADVAAQAHAAGRSVVVGDALDPAEPLTAHADVIVTSARLLGHAGRSLDAQIAALHARNQATVVVSDGPRPARIVWHADGQTHSASVQPPQVVTHDTTGAGDTFRAGVVAGMMRGQPWPAILEHACALASAAIRSPE